MAAVMAMDEGDVKENVNPKSGLVGGRREGKARAGGLGSGLGEGRNRDKLGVLGSNPTLGNRGGQGGGGGGVEALEWLKERLIHHKLASSAKSQAEPDSGSRISKYRLRSSPADGNPAVAGKASGILTSKVTGDALGAQREPSALSSHFSPTHSRVRNTMDRQDRITRDARVSDSLQRDVGVSAKTRRPVNTGPMAIHQDSPCISPDERNVSRGEVQLKPVVTRTSPAAGSAGRGLTSRIDAEQRKKVNQNPHFDTSKSPVSQDNNQEAGRSHLRASNDTGSGCRRRETPNKPVSYHSGNLADRYGKKKSISSRDSSRAVDSPNAAAGGDDVKGLASNRQLDQGGIQLSPSTLALLSRYQHSQKDVKKLSSPKTPGSGSSLSKRQGTPYKVRGVSFQKVTSTSRETHQDPKDLSEGLHPGDERNCGDAGLHMPSKGSIPLSQRRPLSRVSADCNDVGSIKCSWRRARNCPSPSGDAPHDGISNWTPSNMDITAVGHASSAPLTLEWTGASSSGSSSTPDPHTHKSRDSVSRKVKIASVIEEDAKAFESEDQTHSSPFLMENSTAKCEDKLHPTLAAEQGKLTSPQKLRRIQKRLKSLGPPSRVLRNEALESLSSSSSRISSVPTAPPDAKRVSALGNSSCDVVTPDSQSSILTAVDADKDDGELGNSGSDPRKRKAERDPSTGDTSLNMEHSGLCKDGEMACPIGDQSTSTAESSPEKTVEDGGRQLHHVGAIRSLQGSISEDQSTRQAASKSRDGNDGSCRGLQLPVKQGLTSTKSQAGISYPARLTSMVGVTERPAVSWQSTLRSSKSTNGDGRLISSVSHRSGTAMSATHATKDSSPKTDREHAGVRERVAPNGSLLRLSVGKAGRHEGVPDSDRVDKQPGASESRPLSEARESAAMDASHSGGFARSEGNKENEPLAAGGQRCNSLSLESLSLEEEVDAPKPGGSKPPSHSTLNDPPFPPPTSASTTRQTTWTISEDGGAPLPTVHSERLLPATAPEYSGAAAISLSHPVQRDSPLRPTALSAQVVPEKPRVEKVEAAGAQENVRAVAAAAGPSREKTDPETRGTTDDCSQDSGKEHRTGGASAAITQRKVAENAQFVWVNDKRYQKLGRIGKGGSSEVYKVIDGECNIYALKKINLKGRERSIARGFYQEIEYLERLKGKQNVVQLIACEVTNKEVLMENSQDEKIAENACIYMLLEFGEIDLASILSKKRKQMQESNEIIDDNWLRFYWKHMLLAVKTIHEDRIVHADLKPANFLLVKGELKLIDFGIAKAIQNDTTHIVRDSQVGTVNYMSPEAFMTNSMDEDGRVVKCGRASDIWSLGCILYQMVYGFTPFSRVASFYAKIQAITSKNYQIDFPPIPDPWLLDVMQQCLTWDRYSRPHINDLLEHPFLRPELAPRFNKSPRQ